MKKMHGVRTVVGLALLIGPIGFSVAQESTSKLQEPANHVLARELAIERGGGAPTALRAAQPGKIMPGVSGGVMTALHEAFDQQGDNARAASAFGAMGAESPLKVPSTNRSNGCPNVFKGNGGDSGPPDNVRVNQDCTLRRQAEEWVGVNPLDF